MVRSCQLYTLVLILATGCDDVGGAQYVESTWGISGQAFFSKPVADAPLTLYQIDKTNNSRELVGETLTDQEGYFKFDLKNPGDYYIVADLSNLNWSYDKENIRGKFKNGQKMEVFVLDIKMEEDREITISPLTHITSKVSDSLSKIDDQSSPMFNALASIKAHFTIDPINTKIEFENINESINDSIIYHLILDSLWNLSSSISRKAGMAADGLTPPEFLNLLEDDLNGVPLAIFDGKSESGLIEVEGNAIYKFTPELLRNDLADSIESLIKNDEKWSHLKISNLSNFLKNIRCSNSILFEECVQNQQVVDNTAPQIVLIDPSDQDEIISDIKDFSFDIKDVESGIKEAFLMVNGVKMEPSSQDGDLFTFAVDTKIVKGSDLIDLEIVALNNAELEERISFIFKIHNLGKASVSGHVIKGVGSNVIIKAYGIEVDSEIYLGESTSDENGYFSIEIKEFSGSIKFIAIGNVVEGELISSYYDEAHNQFLEWPIESSLISVLPHFDPSDNNNSYIIISPLADLAWSSAIWSDRNNDLAQITAYERALEVLGNHFGLVTPGASDVILYIKPTAHEEPFASPLNNSDRLMLALGCLSQQAKDLSELLWPNNTDKLTALDLIEIYREDIESDGYLDGRKGIINVEIIGESNSVMLSDPFRYDLTESCYRWVQENDYLGIEIYEISEIMDHMSSNQQSIFHPEIYSEGTEYDSIPPNIEISILENEGGTMIENRVKGHLSLFARSIDEKSIIISSEIDVNRHEIIEEALELNGSTAELNATINTDTSEDGEFSLKITSIDFYQNKKEEELVFIADHTGPDISVNLSETSIEYNGWYSGEVYFLPTVVDQYSNNNRFECVAPLRLSESNDSCRLDTGIADDGLFQVSIKAYDDLENESTYDLNLKIDNTEPEIDYNSVHFIGLNQGVAIGSQVSGLVEVSFDLIEEGVGLGEIYINNELFDYSFSLNDQNRYTFNYQIDTSNYSDGEQSILFKVVDLIGNQDDFVINFRVNNTAPDIQTEFIPVENSGYIHNDHFISGLFTLKVTSINANEIYAVSTYNNSSQNVINMEYNEIHHFWTGAFNSRDYVNDGEISLSGNVSNEYNHSDFSMTYQIDNTPPSIDADISSENSVNDWFKDQVNLTSEIEDQLSGIKSIKILKIIGENEEIIDEIEYQNENQILIDEIIDVSNCDRQCLIKLIATDNVNNESIFTRQINVDNSAPTITSLEILPLNNDNVYYNNQTNTFHTKPEFLLNLNNIFDLESGVNSIEITANEQQISIFNDIEQHSSMLLPIDLSQFLNQNVIIFVSIKDHLLNSTEYAINIYIDASSPLCSVSIQHPENNESSEYENPANFSFEVPIKDAIVFSIICNDDSGDSYRLSYLNENQNEVIVDVPLNELFEINYDLENIADGQHQFNLRILDVMRNESSAQISYIVDQTPPYVEAHLDNNLLLPGEIFYIVPGISFLTFDIYDEIQLNPVLNDPFLRIIHVESGGIVYNNNLRGQFPGLHINLDNPGHYSITFTVQDHIGNESIYEYTILAYENAPDFMFLPSIVQNEADYIAIKNAQNEVVLERPANSEPIQLGDNSDHSTPIKIYKLQSTWGAGDPNLPILKFQIEEDNPLGGVGRLEVWYLVGRFEDGAHGMTSNIVCSGNHGGLSTARKINDNQFELTLNEEALGLRPMSDPSRAVPTKLVLFTCDSFATMTAYEFNLDIRLYPTPVLIEDLGFDGYNGANVPITSNTITYSSVVSALNGVSDQTSLLLGRFKFSKPINTQSVNIYFREMSNATMYGYVKYIPDENFSIQVESHQNECNFMSSHSEIAKLDINANGTYTINSCLSKPRPLYLSNSFYYTNLIGSNVSDLDVRVSDEEIIEVTSRLRDFTPNEIDIINDSTDWNSIQQTAVYTNYRYLWDYDKDTFCINQIGCYSGIWAGKLILYLSRITFNYHKTINYRLYIPCENQSCPHLYEVNKVKPANSSTRSLNR